MSFLLVVEGNHVAHGHSCEAVAASGSDTAFKCTATHLASLRGSTCGSASVMEARWSTAVGDSDCSAPVAALLAVLP